MSELVNGKVWADYRDNIIVDHDNPILAFKANRDRYTEAKSQSDYAGLAQIGSVHSEDALTWNVFRTLAVFNQLKVLEPLLGKLDDPQVLLWTLSFSPETDKLQYVVGETIRSIDGKHMGQITEPDVIIKTKDKVFVIECKLGEVDKATHLWQSHQSNKPLSEQGPQKRKKDYFVDNENPFKKDASLDLYSTDEYQLYRMAFYAYQLGKKLKTAACCVSLTNENWWKQGANSAETIFAKFHKEVDAKKLALKSIFWQDIAKQVNSQDDYRLGMLKEYLKKHPCLQSKE